MVLAASILVILLAVATAVTVAGLLKHLSLKRMRDAVANLPGPFCLPLLGAVQHFTSLSPENFLQQARRMNENYGRVLAVWALTRLIIVSGDIELNEQLLSSQQHIVKHRNYRMLQPWLGTGLLMSDGKKWHNRRKIITPAFHFKILEQFVDVFDQQSAILLQKLRPHANGCMAIDVSHFICLTALDIIAETAMGTKVYAQQKRSEYIVAVNRLTKLMAWRFMNVIVNSDLSFMLFCPHLMWRQRRLIRTMHAFTTRVIEERRRELEQQLHQGHGQRHELGEKKRMALLDVLLQSHIDGQPLSNEDIREEVDTFMFEGHDTTTSGICFALYFIACHPEVQRRLHAEWQTIIGGAAITLRALNDLKYMECVIKETLRMYPSVPIIGRELQQDFAYKHSVLGEGIIPAGSEFLIYLHGMMHDAERFPQPDRFDPDRHLNGECAGSAFSLIPFSAGPRNCIGQKFALLEMKTIIGKVVSSYELLPLGEDVRPELNIVMRSSNGFQLGMRPRDT